MENCSFYFIRIPHIMHCRKELSIPQWGGLGEKGESWFQRQHGRPGQSWSMCAGRPLPLKPDGGRHPPGAPSPLPGRWPWRHWSTRSGTGQANQSVPKKWPKDKCRKGKESHRHPWHHTQPLERTANHPHTSTRTPTIPRTSRSSRRWSARESLDYPAVKWLRPQYTTPPSRTLGTRRDCSTMTSGPNIWGELERGKEAGSTLPGTTQRQLGQHVSTPLRWVLSQKFTSS